MPRSTKKLIKSEEKITKPQPVSNGHLTYQEKKKTIVLTWGKYSITLVCLTAIIIALIQKIKV
jgi:hypothetical protein